MYSPIPKMPGIDPSGRKLIYGLNSESLVWRGFQRSVMHGGNAPGYTSCIDMMSC